MAGKTDIIGRARELAALAKEATPGQWRVWPGRVVRAEDGTYICSAYPVDAKNAELIAAAPEMAGLLRELADELYRTREALARYEGTTVFVCHDCGARCLGED